MAGKTGRKGGGAGLQVIMEPPSGEPRFGFDNLKTNPVNSKIIVLETARTFSRHLMDQSVDHMEHLLRKMRQLQEPQMETFKSLHLVET